MDGKGPRGHLARWRFGTVEVDESVATVRRGEELVSLDRSSYDVLRALLRNAGEVVTKDELLEAGWPGRVVSENSLAKAISRLRAALGEEAATLRVVHGYGYRLATTVAIEAVPPGVDPVAPPTLAHLHPGDEVPQRPGWRLLRRIGEGASGIIWLARSDAGESRALKFADSLEGVRCLKREIALARYLASVGDAGAGIVPVLGWNLSHAPFFLELPWMEAGNLHDWARDRGGLAAIPRTDRIDLCVQLCEAVAILQERPDLLACNPLPGPPRADGRLLSQKKPPLTDPRGPGYYRFTTLSSRVFLLDRRHLATRLGGLRRVWAPFKAAVSAMLAGRVPYDGVEGAISKAMRRRGVFRLDFLGSGPGMWSVHPLHRTPAYVRSVPEVIRMVEAEDIPEAQRGEYDLTPAFLAIAARLPLPV